MDKALLTRATSKEDSPTPGYLYGEIARMTQHSYDTCSKVLDFLISRVKNKHHTIKFKALQVIKHVCRDGRVDFKREMQKHIPTIKECLRTSAPLLRLRLLCIVRTHLLTPMCLWHEPQQSSAVRQIRSRATSTTAACATRPRTCSTRSTTRTRRQDWAAWACRRASRAWGTQQTTHLAALAGAPRSGAKARAAATTCRLCRLQAVRCLDTAAVLASTGTRATRIRAATLVHRRQTPTASSRRTNRNTHRRTAVQADLARHLRPTAAVHRSTAVRQRHTTTKSSRALATQCTRTQEVRR